MTYSADAIGRARDGAIEWLKGSQDGYPRSWQEEERANQRRGYLMHEEDWEAPPIAGYESLELDGMVIRIGVIKVADGEERVHFKRIDPYFIVNLPCNISVCICTRNR